MTKGDYRYVVKNENGQIQIVKREGNVDFSVPMSDRTPVGKKYPRMSMDQCLSPESKQIYRDSYSAFLDSKGKRIIHNASDMITENNLLHGTSLDALLGADGILENGLVPREISGNASAHYRDGSIPNTLTPYCTDVWDVRQTMSIKEYFDSNSSHWASNRGESSFLSNTSEFGQRSQVVVVLDKNSMHPDLLRNSFNVNPSGESQLIKDGCIGGINDGIHDYPTHRAVPIGAPSNAIDRIIIDTRSCSPRHIETIRQKIAEKGLDIKLYDLYGNIL